MGVWHAVRVCNGCGVHVESEASYIQIVRRDKKATRSRKHEVVATYCFACAKEKGLPVRPERRFPERALIGR